MLAVPCPQVMTARQERLVSEQRITALAATPTGWELTVRCPCGDQHAVPITRAR